MVFVVVLGVALQEVDGAFFGRGWGGFAPDDIESGKAEDDDGGKAADDAAWR